MPITSPRTAGILVSALLTASSYAADVRVSYLVDAKALKTAAASTPLTFQLFTDGSCNTPVTSQTVDARNVNLIELITPRKVRGSGKKARPARVEHVMRGVAPQPTFYLKITGPGVIAV